MLKAKKSVRNDPLNTLSFPDSVHKIFIKFNSILVIVLSREGTKYTEYSYINYNPEKYFLNIF